MTQRAPQTTHSCPKCNAALSRENGVLRCEAHGTFFTYGPHLLVRLPRVGVKLAETLMPWENRKAHSLR